MTTLALIQLGLALLPLVQQGVPAFITWLESLKAAAQQAGEWTDALDAEFRAKLFAKTQDPRYAPDAA